MKNILLENLRFNNLNFFMGNYLDNFVDGLYEGNLSPKVIDTPQSEESIAAYKKAAEEKRKRRAEKRKEKSNEKSNEFNR